MDIITSSRPVYQTCSNDRCGKSVLYQDYISVLAQAGVNVVELMDHMFLDSSSCCSQHIMSHLPPYAEQEYIDRLEVLKEIRLQSPPSFYTASSDEVRPMYVLGGAPGSHPTDHFLGAEPYYYLVERGENPRSILKHLDIRDPEDVNVILNATDRPSVEYECRACGEYIPHHKYTTYIYQTGKQDDKYLSSPDRLKPCCREQVSQDTLADRDRDAIEAYVSSNDLTSGVPVSNVPAEECVSCGTRGTGYYHDYSWLVHRGVPSSIAINYFGLMRPCCRQHLMNPARVIAESRAVQERRLIQQATEPEETVIDYDYAAVRLPTLQGAI